MKLAVLYGELQRKKVLNRTNTSSYFQIMERKNRNWERLRSELTLFKSTANWYMPNATGFSRESNPSQNICNLQAVSLTILKNGTGRRDYKILRHKQFFY